MILKKTSLRFFLTLSFFLHVGLSVLAFALSNSFLFQSRNTNLLIESAIQVDQIDLSNLKKISSTDLTKIPKANSIKKEQKKKKKPAKKAKEKKEEVVIKKESKETEKKKEQDKIDTEKQDLTQENLKPEEQDSKQEEEETEQGNEQETQEETEEKNEQETEEENETIPQDISGEEQEGSNSSELSVQEISELSYYAQQISNKVKNNWKIPSYLKDKSLATEVEIKINTQGRIISKKIILSSGDDFFDSFVLKTVEKADPYPSPPLLVQKMIADGIVLNFDNQE